MIIKIGSSVTWMVTERTYKGLDSAVDCNVVLEGFSLVGFVITMSTIEFENTSMSIFTVKHLIKSHVSITTFITPKIISQLGTKTNLYISKCYLNAYSPV